MGSINSTITNDDKTNNIINNNNTNNIVNVIPAVNVDVKESEENDKNMNWEENISEGWIRLKGM